MSTKIRDVLWPNSPWLRVANTISLTLCLFMLFEFTTCSHDLGWARGDQTREVTVRYKDGTVTTYFVSWHTMGGRSLEGVTTEDGRRLDKVTIPKSATVELGEWR